MKCVSTSFTAVCILLAGGVLVSAQEAEVATPEGWTVSPDNDRAPGESGYRIVHAGTGIELVWVPGGAFKMGSEEGDPDERPVHEVEVDGFWIGRTEVSVWQWREVMVDVPFAEVNTQGEDHPLVLVSHDAAQAFCEKLGLRLATEAEWEYAAAGPEARVYPWGDWWDGDLLQWGGNRHGHERTAPVGSFPEGGSWCGALDMAGNVWEWCADWYDEAYYAVSPRTNPPGPAGDIGASAGFPDGSKKWWRDRRVIRGGCFANDDPSHFRCAMRNSDPSAAHYGLGFRVARSR